MHTWTGAGGLTIAGDTWGDPHGPLVVLQHGGGQTRHAWKGAGEALGNTGYHEAGAQRFLAQCPHAEYVNVANAAHMVAGDRNDIFAASIIAFLKRVAPPR
jgi:pimeloyl-ACP methyl ester carboxylesterase